jgi:polar amino acid transport system permease protein
MPSYIWDFSFLVTYQSLIVTGIFYTLVYTAVCVILGMLVGVLTALPRLSDNIWVCGPFRAYVEVFRCTPVLVQLVWFYSEIFRGGIVSVDEGQSEAARALGMRRGQVMWRVVLPQALKRMIPPLVNQSIMQLKNTSLLSVLALPDLLYQGQVIAHDSYRPLEVYSVIAVAYFVILLPATMLSKRLERRMSRNAGA